MIYFFENFSFDIDRRELRRGDNAIATEPQVFDLLLYLIRHRNRVVSKDDLIAAVWRSRIVSESTLSSRIAAVRRAVGDRGDEQRLIRTFARKGLRFIGSVSEEKGPRAGDAALEASGAALESPARRNSQVAPALSLRERPSIVVLPFANISHGPEQECLIDGLIEDIATELSRFRWFFVLTRSASVPYKGRAIDVKRIGRELGVRYAIEGSVRTAANRVRIAVQLTDTMTAAHLWANRFDGEVMDIFDLQDQVTAGVVGAIGPKLEQLEIERAKCMPTENSDPYHYYLRGMGSLQRWSRDGISEALRLFQKAVKIDPEFGPAYGMAAYCYVQRQSYGWLTDRPQEIAASARLARQAAELAADDAVALSKAAHAISTVVGDVDSGVVFIDQALRLNPNLAAGWYVSGWLRIFLGQPEVSIEHLAHAMRLSPFHPLIFKMQAALAYAQFLARRYDDASEAAENALRARPNYLTAVRGAAASHALAGRLDRAQRLIAHMRRRDPALRISNLAELIPFRRSEDFERWAEGLGKAGLPE